MHCHYCSQQFPGWGRWGAGPEGLSGASSPKGCPGNSRKTFTIQKIFTFKRFPNLSPLYHGWKCPKCEPIQSLFSFGISACQIRKMPSKHDISVVSAPFWCFCSLIHHISIKPHVNLMASSCSMPATTLSSFFHLNWVSLCIYYQNPLGTV